LNFAIIIVDKAARRVNIILGPLMPEMECSQPRWIGNVILHLDLDSFFPSCEEMRDPALAGKPHAVIMTDQDNNDAITKGVVASCSYEARKLGVRSAMPLSKALNLCPNLILKAVDIPYYRQVSGKVMNILEEYADVLEQASIDEAYLDCTKKVIARVEGEEIGREVGIKEEISDKIAEYATKIKDAVKEQCGLSCSIGVGITKSVAKIASDFQKPNGLTIVYPNDTSKFLEPLEVGRISGIGTKTQQVLIQAMEIKTIGQLAKYDVQKLMDSFGRKTGLWMWQVANGKDNDIVSPREDNISISTEETLDHATSDKVKVLQYLNELVDEVYERVKTKGYVFRTVGVKLVRSDFSIETREISYSNLRNDKESIASVLERLVDRFSFANNNDNTSNGKVAFRKVGIKISNLTRLEGKKKPYQQKTLLDYI
jgi:DNA polymerase IV (DinB-like DNA polymerase)